MIGRDPIILISTAVIILIILLIGIIYIFRNYQNRKNALLKERLELKLNLQSKEIDNLQALEKQRRRIYNDLHDNIGSTLAAAMLQANYLKSTQKDGKDKNELNELEKMIAQSYEQLKEIVWYMSRDKTSLSDLVDFVKEYAYSFLGKTSVALNFKENTLTPHHILSTQLRKDMYYSVKELLHNIIKHSQANRAWVTIMQNEKELIITVRDNGNGIINNKNIYEDKINSNGLKSLSTRAKKHNGKISVLVQNGFEVTLTFAFPEESLI